MRAGTDRCHQRAGKIGAIGAVAIEEQNDAASLARRRHTRRTGTAVAALGKCHDACAGRLRNRRGTVPAGTVGDNDLVDHVARQHRDRAGDRCGLVERRDDSGDAGQRWQGATGSTASHTPHTAEAVRR